MRFALIATSLAAVAAIPLGVAASGPQMSGEEFLTAVRCTAYTQTVRPQADLGAERMFLNAEARRQSAETARAARAEVIAVAREAVAVANSGEAAMMRSERVANCEGAPQGTTLAGASEAPTV